MIRLAKKWNLNGEGRERKVGRVRITGTTLRLVETGEKSTSGRETLASYSWMPDMELSRPSGSTR
jgi:hypothetical protein